MFFYGNGNLERLNHQSLLHLRKREAFYTAPQGGSCRAPAQARQPLICQRRKAELEAGLFLKTKSFTMRAASSRRFS